MQILGIKPDKGNIVAHDIAQGHLMVDPLLDSTNGARVVSVLRPLDENRENGSVSTAQKEAFKKAFFATLKGEAQGLLTPYLFYDPPKVSPQLEQEIWGSKGPVNVGARAWDLHISESVSSGFEVKPSNSYGFANGDVEVINTALDEGLLNQIPTGNIAYFGYGVGETFAVTNKDGLLLSRMIQAGKNVISTCAVDMNDRYATKGSQYFHDKFNRDSKGICGDFMEGTLPISKQNNGSVTFVGIFGGPFGNAPQTQDNPKTNAARYLSKITEQHGPGTHVLMSVEMKPKGKLSEEFLKQVIEEYAPTKSFEAFLLSAFPRAVYEGIIQKPYDVFKNWEMVTGFDDNLSAVKLVARCKKDHIINTVEGDFEVLKGYETVPILSNKWDEDEIQSIFNVAGASYYKLYGTGTRRLVHAVMGRRPDMNLA